MRRIISLMVLATSCCLLLITSGCNPEQDVVKGDTNHDAKENKASNPAQTPVVGGDQAPIIIPPTGGPVGPKPTDSGKPNAGGGGGSQGAERPADTGNPDNDPLEPLELICNDKIDNNGNGLIDCADPNCAEKPCSDMNGCTVNDTCHDGVCLGTPRNCEEEVGNECTIDTCEPVDMLNDTYRCVSVLDESKTGYNSCTADDNCLARNPDGSCKTVDDTCIVGHCVAKTVQDTLVYECESANRVDLTTDIYSLGCKDDNTCTADMCKDGVCMYSELNGNPCDDGNACTTMDTCSMGDCVAMNVPNTCTDDAQCAKGTTCRSTPGTCAEVAGSLTTLAEGDPCFTAEDCSGSGMVCIGAVLGGCSCDDGNTCTTPDTCDDGECEGAIPTSPVTCSDGNPCTDDVCTQGECISTIDNTNECSDNIACTSSDTCTAGECGGTPNDEACYPQNYCQEGSCSVDNGCEFSLITGPSTHACDLVLNEVGLPAAINSALDDLNIPLNCNIGVNACLNGTVGECGLSAVFADACTADTLNTACETTVFTLEANTGLAASVCAGLVTIATP